jgi:hypothetical protein
MAEDQKKGERGGGRGRLETDWKQTGLQAEEEKAEKAGRTDGQTELSTV